MRKKSELVKFPLYFEEARPRLRLRDRLKGVTVKSINQHHKMLQSK